MPVFRDNTGNDQCQSSHTSGNIQLDADLFSKIIASKVSNRITSESFCFQAGTLL